jgi:O-antigen/teichoic acid export membrane protein
MSENLLRRIVANAGLLVAGKGVNAIFSLAYLALATRALGLEGMGFLLLIHTYAQAVGEIARFQSSEAVLRFGTPALHRAQIGAFQALIKLTGLLDIFSGAAATVLATLACGLAAGWIGVPADLVPAATVYCLSVAFMATATPTGLLRLFGRFDLLATQSAVGSLVRLAGSIVLFLLGGGVVEFLVVWFIATACANAALVAFAWRETARRNLLTGIDHSFNLRELALSHAGFWRFAGTNQVNASLAMLSTHLATLLVGGLLGAAEAALYRIARELAEAIAKPTKLLIPAIYPELAQLAAAGSLERMRRLVLHALGIAAMAAIVCLAAIWLGGEPLLRLVAGDAGVPAHQLMVLLGLASLLALAAFPLEPLLICVGQEGDALRARLAALLLYILLVSLLVPAAGLSGAGIAAIAAALIMVAGQVLATVRWFAREGAATNGARRARL